MNVRTYLVVLLALCLAPAAALAQDYLYATGSPVYATTIPIDHGFVNVNNGDVHIEIPLVSKAQRGGLALQEKLIYDSRLWKPVANGSTASWQPTNVPNSQGGWMFSSGVNSGTITYSRASGSDPQGPDCPGPAEPEPYTRYLNWTWTDPSGTSHSFPNVETLQYQQGEPECRTPTRSSNSGLTTSASGTASDASGYTLSISDSTTPTIYDAHGTVYHPAVTDGTSLLAFSTNVVNGRNGNYWSADASGNLIDTSGLTPVVASSNGATTIYGVLGVNGVRENYTVREERISYNTNFGIYSITEASGSFAAIQSISLPDGSSYQFTYDSSTDSGHYGELLSMTLPTGGTIYFTYQAYSDSYGNRNQWVHTIKRDGGTTTIAPAVVTYCSGSSSCSQSVVVTNPDNNQTAYTFNMDPQTQVAGSAWINSIRSYDGSALNGTLLQTASTSYAYASSTPTYTFENTSYTDRESVYTYPYATTQTVTLNDIGVSSQTSSSFDIAADPTDTKSWNFGNSPSSAPDFETKTVYGGDTFPTSIITLNGSGNQISQVTYGYDESAPATTSGLPSHNANSYTDGSLTSEHDWINTSNTTLTTTMTYDNAGTLVTSTPPTGTTTYGHDSLTDTVVTNATAPTPSSGVSLASSAAYDGSTYAATSTTDPNGQQTTYKGYDSLNRPTEIDYPDGGKTFIVYRSPVQTGVLSQRDSNHTSEVETLLDGYGRTSRVAQAENAAAGIWYQQDTCYDTSGRVSFQSYRYQGPGFGAAKVCSGAGDSYSYDALGRVIGIAHGDGSRIAYQYAGRATKVTDQNGVARITQVDAFGRPTIVCEISPNTLQGDAPGSCGTDIPGGGFVTSYSYDLANHKTTVTQGVQTRVFQTDSLGRTIFTSEPERGVTTYSYNYNSTGLQVVRTRPKANQTNPAVTTATTTQYDTLGRPVQITYSDGSPERDFRYDQSVGWSYTQNNLKGRLSAAITFVLGNNDTSVFGYDAMGRTTLVARCFPYGCGNANKDKSSSGVYDQQGNLISATDATNGIVNYTYSDAAEVTGITGQVANAGAQGTLLSNVQNGPNGPVSYTLGNGLGEYITYDGLGRNTGKWLCQGGTPSAYCQGDAHQVYGTQLAWSGDRVTGNCDTAINTCRGFGYDEFDRLQSQTGPQGFTYVYDRYGNRWQQNVTAGSGPQFQIGFDKGNNRDCDACYDAAGNKTYDGIYNYTYDAEGNVTAVNGGQTATYTYDALNRRFRVKNAQNTVDYQFDVLGRRSVVWQENADFGIRDTYWWGGQPFAYHGFSGGTYYEQQDWLGTERMRTDSTGKTVATYFSLPFGDGFSSTGGSDETPDHFAGTERNAETYTDHAQFRQYQEGLGRWMSGDPYLGSYNFGNPQSFNRYSYAGNNPLALRDPSGLDSQDCWYQQQSGLDPNCSDNYAYSPPDDPPPGYSPSGVNTSDGNPIYTDSNGNQWIGSPGSVGTGNSGSTVDVGLGIGSGFSGLNYNILGGGGGLTPSNPAPPSKQSYVKQILTQPAPCGGGYGQPCTPAPPPTKEDLCHAAAVAALSGLLAIPGVDIPVGAAWGLYGVGAATGIAGVTLCW